MKNQCPNPWLPPFEHNFGAIDQGSGQTDYGNWMENYDLVIHDLSKDDAKLLFWRADLNYDGMVS